jgi:hypothetical protein
MGKIVVIGDSHSQLFSNLPQLNRGVWSSNEFDIFDVRWLGPVTYWRLSRDGDNFINFNSDIFYTPHFGFDVTTKVNIDDDIMISLGEIDIRCNLLKNYDNYKDGIDLIINNLTKYLNRYLDYKIHLISIIPPISKEKCTSHNSELPFIGSDKDRSDMTIYFNHQLKELSDKIGFKYFDIYSLYKDKDGMLDFDKSDKIVHGLKNNELENYIKKYFNL